MPRDITNTLEDDLHELARTVKRDSMKFCAKAAALHVSESKSAEYNQAALDIAAKILELAGSAPNGRAA